MKYDNSPGLAMSRSLGDLVAHSCGVSSEPGKIPFTILSVLLEITKHELDPEEDKFVILGSDGLWEFISNEEAIKVAIPYFFTSNPKGACDELV
jgi:serine/threonine protein phosphatase PrpC